MSAPGSVIDHMAPTRGRFSGRMIAGDDDIIPHHMYQLEGPCLLAADEGLHLGVDIGEGRRGRSIREVSPAPEGAVLEAGGGVMYVSIPPPDPSAPR